MSEFYSLTSDDLQAVRKKLERQRHYLASETFLTDSGQVKTLLDVSLSANHSQRYYAMVLNKVNTFVSYNFSQGLTPVFLTITLDGFFRDFLRGDYSRWPKYRDKYLKHIPNNDRFGYMFDRIDQGLPLDPKDLYKILSYQWHRFLRSYSLQKLRKDGLRYTFIRVTEPHKDGVPHFHVLFYLPEAFLPKLYFHFRNFFPAPQNHKIISKSRNGRQASYFSKDIYETQGFQWKIDSVAGYILKYILKSFRNVKDNKDIDYLQAWYVHYRIPRIVMSHTLIPQDVFLKSFNLDPDWYYLTEIRDLSSLPGSLARYIRSRLFDTFLFDDSSGRVLYYDNGYCRITHNGLVVKEVGEFRSRWSVLPPASYSLWRIGGNFWLSSLYRRSKLRYVYTDTHTRRSYFPIELDGSIYFLTSSGLRPPEYVLPVRKLTDLQLMMLYYEFDFDVGDPKRFGLVRNEMIHRGLLDDVPVSLNEYDCNFDV